MALYCNNSLRRGDGVAVASFVADIFLGAIQTWRYHAPLIYRRHSHISAARCDVRRVLPFSPSLVPFLSFFFFFDRRMYERLCFGARGVAVCCRARTSVPARASVHGSVPGTCDGSVRSCFDFFFSAEILLSSPVNLD